jgi:hypothetical protein
VDEAFEETSPRRQVMLARRAIEISADCADAYVLLADNAPTRAESISLYEQAVAAGERAIGDDRFKEYAGRFWGFLETRPYMRAREGLADCLWEEGRKQEAAEHCRAMLRLNPNDNQGMRYRLVSMLLHLGLYDELEQLLKKYEDDASAEWAYTRALLAFRLEGDTVRAREFLAQATDVNAHVPLYLARVKPIPRVMPDYITFGGEDEAIGYCAQFLAAWRETEGATAWLRRTLNLAPTAGPPNQRLSWSKLRSSLARLPQCDDETWELDFRHIAVPPGGELKPQWMFVAINVTGGQVVHFEFLDDSPKVAEAWKFLIAAIREPQYGEPRRPATVRVARQSWLRSWRQKLQEIGIECEYGDSLEQLDGWFQSVLPELEKVQRSVDQPIPTDHQWSKIASLPQRHQAIWQADVQRLPLWLDVDGESKRPFASLVADLNSGAILATMIECDEPPDDLLLKSVWQALCAPAIGPAHRPGTIQVASDGQREILAKPLAAIGVGCVACSELAQVRTLINELASQIGGPSNRSLIHSPDVTTAQLGDFFEAAEHFYRARPWREVPGDCVIRIASDRFKSGPWYAVVMGQSGIEQGLAIYEDLRLLRKMIAGQLSDEEAGRRTSAISMTYGEASELAPQDMDALEEHGWPVAGPDTYPCVLRVNPGLAIRTPLKWELELLEGSLRALPDFLVRRVDTAEIAVPLRDGPSMFHFERMA